MKENAQVTGDVRYNELTNNGTIDGALLTPLTLPLAIEVPAFPAITPGSSPAGDVTVQGSADLTLAAGSYGNVKLLQGTNNDPTMLTLSGGVYHLLELDVGEDSSVECASACELRLQGKLSPGEDAYIGPQPGTSLGAEDVLVFVAGQNGSSGNLGATPRAAEIGMRNSVEARIFAPNGTLWIKEHTVAIGTFVARDVLAGIDTTITKDDAAPPGEPDCMQHCQDLVAAGCENGPPSVPACTQECEDGLAGDFCVEQLEALVLCSNTSGAVQCDGQGEPVIVGCESEASDFATCETVCAEADDGNACTEDLCNCTLASCDPLDRGAESAAPAWKLVRQRRPLRRRGDL